MDKCTAHRGLDKKNFCRDSGIPENLIVIFLPPNFTGCYQPMNMGIITYFKVGYHVQLLYYILQIFGVEEGYEALKAHRKRAKPGCKGLHIGGNPTMLDLMDLSVGIWNSNAKYNL